MVEHSARNPPVGEFSDVKLVKTRGVLQLVFEVPLERADAALAFLGGVPKIGEGTWVAMYPLAFNPYASGEVLDAKPEAPAVAAPAAPFDLDIGKRALTRAVMLCKEGDFGIFLLGRPGTGSPWPEDTVSSELQRRLGVSSRRYIGTQPDIFDRWKAIEAAYHAHRDEQRSGPPREG